MSESDRLKLRFAGNLAPVKQRWKDDYKKFANVYMERNNTRVISEEVIRPIESFTVHFKKNVDYVIRRQYWTCSQGDAPLKEVWLSGPKMENRVFLGVPWPVKAKQVKK